METMPRQTFYSKSTRSSPFVLLAPAGRDSLAAGPTAGAAERTTRGVSCSEAPGTTDEAKLFSLNLMDRGDVVLPALPSVLSHDAAANYIKALHNLATNVAPARLKAFLRSYHIF